MAEGWTNAEMAKHLHLSVDTVKTHLFRLYRATGARDRAHLVTWAFLSGLLVVEPTGQPMSLASLAVA